MINKRCGTCKHLDIRLNKAGHRVPNKNTAYRCLWPAENIKMPNLPISITGAYGYTNVDYISRNRRHVSHDDGVDCPTWEKYAKCTN